MNRRLTVQMKRDDNERIQKVSAIRKFAKRNTDFERQQLIDYAYNKMIDI